MKRIVLAVLLAVTAAFGLAASPASALPTYSAFSYYDSAGATQVQALGVTVQSNPTAESLIVGNVKKTATHKIASAKAGTLLNAGVATTSTTATVTATRGLNITAHSHTANVSLLGGMIKIGAVDTISTVKSNGTGKPSVSMTTQLLGLSINGKTYPADINPNTGITIPGVVSIMLNSQQISRSAKAATVIGAGLKVTLLGSRNGATAGASIGLNPITQVMQPGNGQIEPGYALGGTSYGAYVYANVGGQVQAETGRVGMITMPAQGTGGRQMTNATARGTLTGVLNLGSISGSQVGIRSDALSQSKETATIANVSLFNGLITAKGLITTATAKVTPTSGSAFGGMTFVTLRIAGQDIPVDVAPNTTINVANLGRVTINERTRAVKSGTIHAYRTIGLHIVLDTARAGLPVGAQIEVATAQAQVWY